MTPFVSLPTIIVSIDLRRFLRVDFFGPLHGPRDHKFMDRKISNAQLSVNEFLLAVIFLGLR